MGGISSLADRDQGRWARWVWKPAMRGSALAAGASVVFVSSGACAKKKWRIEGFKEN
ncbi:hypothetical protein TorRG33x02_055650 [Trema orientale]|uniref:Uncharacterized protein n=1 Tax=Trema orientale TaxID=63057 RepID=A0A2P5FLI3_TREOI|nr:hypothetical protein TorRG33x02_055650 [Trema orientale]